MKAAKHRRTQKPPADGTAREDLRSIHQYRLNMRPSCLLCEMKQALDCYSLL